MTPRDSHNWNELVGLGLLPNVTSLTVYERLSAKGAAAAYVEMLRAPLAIPTATTALAAHKTMFGSIYPCAGRFRQPLENVAIGGVLGCDPDSIQFELRLLESQTSEILGGGDPSAIQKLTAVAFYHARFELLHPFNDGNGRVGRLLADGQSSALDGGHVPKAWPGKEEYFSALISAQRGDDLAALMRMIADRTTTMRDTDIPSTSPSPFRIKTGFYDEDEMTDFASCLKETRRVNILPLPSTIDSMSSQNRLITGI